MKLMESYDAAIRETHVVVAHHNQCSTPGCAICLLLEDARQTAVDSYYTEAESLTEHPNMLRHAP
jgi:hypothetical protein